MCADTQQGHVCCQRFQGSSVDYWAPGSGSEQNSRSQPCLHRRPFCIWISWSLFQGHSPIMVASTTPALCPEPTQPRPLLAEGQSKTWREAQDQREDKGEIPERAILPHQGEGRGTGHPLIWSLSQDPTGSVMDCGALAAAQRSARPLPCQFWSQPSTLSSWE